MKAQICRRCMRLSDERPKTAMCVATRAPHVWVAVDGALGLAIHRKRQLAIEQAKARAAEAKATAALKERK